MKKRKLEISDLKVSSFVTSMEGSQSDLLLAGGLKLDKKGPNSDIVEFCPDAKIGLFKK